MLDNPNLFWKNFRLGTELQVSGSFIYNGIFTLENMQTFYYEHECFEFLYDISVGIERLMKVAVILIEHKDQQSREDFEKSLITHNKLELLARIKKSKDLNLGKQHLKLLYMLDSFYKSARYDRYNISSVYHPNVDKGLLIDFVSNELKIEINTEFLGSTEVSDSIKRFLGKLIGKLTTQLYSIIRSEARRLNIYTYEIASGSKAFKIFMAKEFDFHKEKLMQREVALYLLKSMPDGQLKKFINEIDPLEFEQLHTNKYFEGIFNIHKDRQVMDEMEYLYEENRIKYDRVDKLMAIGSDINFEDFEDFGDFDEK